MGTDEDIIVLSFVVKDKSPAQDLMMFLESGYDFVLDADVSAGTMEDGEYLVFAEIERNADANVIPIFARTCTCPTPII